MNEQATKYRSLDNWFKTPQGKRVGIAFASEIEAISAQFNGNTLLQLGNCGANSWLSSLQYRHKWVITPYVDIQHSKCTTLLNHLPLDRNSIDCVVCPLSMEAFPLDKNVLHEIDRILKPMGYIVFFGINPFSFWGLSLRLRRLACFGHAPATLMSSLSLKHKLSYLGYQQCFHNSFYYIPPVLKEYWIQKCEFFNLMGKMLWPFPAGFYCIVVQKYQYVQPSRLIYTTDDNNILLRPSVIS